MEIVCYVINVVIQSNLMSLAKLVSSAAFAQHVRSTFVLHRDLRSCLSLSEAELLVRQREVQIRDYGKTAFLQFLNSFPLNYSYKMLSSPLRLFAFSAQLQGLSTYEEQLRYTVLSKLKEYVCLAEKATVQELIEQSEQALMVIKQTRPFDTAHAINFLLLQKDSRNSELFEHCLEVIKRTDYYLFKSLMHRTIPIFIKRLTMDDWSVIRRFDYLLEALAFDFIPRDIMTMYYSHIIEKIAQMQLHTICYLKIPPSIDFIIGYFARQVESNRELQLNKLQAVMKAFDYLPMGYNEKAFQLFFSKLLQRAEGELIYVDMLPYRRLSNAQVANLFRACAHRSLKMQELIYSGNSYEARKAYLKTDQPLRLRDEFMAYALPHGKFITSWLVAATLLIDYFRGDVQAMAALGEKMRAVLALHRQDISRNSRGFTICHIFNLMAVEQEVKLGGLNNAIRQLVAEAVSRANNNDFKELKFLDNIIEAVLLYADSPLPQVRSTLVALILGMTRKIDKFYFAKYSELIFALCKSEHYSEYRHAVAEMLKCIKKDDCGFLVELYNRYPSKSLKLYTNFFGQVKGIDVSLQCMGRFMITSSYTHLTSSRGELQLDFRKALEAIEPSLSINSLKGFYLPEVTLMLKFSSKFFFFISEFARKLLMVSLSHVDSLDCAKDGGKMMLSFIQEATALALTSNAPGDTLQMILAQLVRLRQALPENLMVKAKELQFRWLLGAEEAEDRRSLIVEEILSELSSHNYSQKYSDVMMTLLKLHSLEAITLKKVVEEKLLQLVLDGLDSNEVRANEIVNQLYLPFRKGGSSFPQAKTAGISRILQLVLEKTGGRQNFDYYMRLVEFADYGKDEVLLGKALDCMAQVYMSPSQVRKLMNLLRFHRSVEIGRLGHKLLKDTDTLFDYMRQECAEILYSVHLSKNEVSLDELALTKTLLRKHEKHINDSWGKHEFSKLAAVIKHLWVALKINDLTVQMQPLFKFAIENYKDTKSDNKGNFFGVPHENVAFIYEAVIKFIQLNDPKLIEEFRQEQVKTLFKSTKPKGLPNAIVAVQQDNKKLIDFLITFFTEEQQKTLSKQLLRLGFSVNSKDSHPNSNVFEINKNINGVYLNGWVRKDGKEYGIMYINERYLTSSGALKGRVNFSLNCLEAITGVTNIAFRPGQELSIP